LPPQLANAPHALDDGDVGCDVGCGVGCVVACLVGCVVGSCVATLVGAGVAAFCVDVGAVVGSGV